MMEFTGRRAELKAGFIEARGYWSDFWDSILALNPDYFEIYLRYSSLPWKKGPLSPKMKEFIYIAIDVATTHLYEPGLRIHIQNAVKYGATKEEIMEVIILCSALGIHAVTFGVPVLVDELQKAGRGDEINRIYSERQEQLKGEFENVRGYWRPFWDDLLAIDPDFFECFLDLSGAPVRTGILEPKARELIYIAIDASATHMYEPGLRIHIQQAFKYGATVDEIMEVLQLTSVLGMHSCTMGVPALVDELAKLGQTIAPND